MEIKVSNIMDRYKIEDRFIRMNLKLRRSYNLGIGERVLLDGVPLQIERSYKEDTGNFAYVTTNTASKLTDANKLFLIKEVTMGADPEVFLINNGKLISPNIYFKKWPAVGYDGLLLEFRPAPHTNPEKVVLNIKNLIKYTKNKLEAKGAKDTRLFAASSGFELTAGFHCHMGLPRKFLQKRHLNYKTLLQFFIKALDYHVGILSIIPEGDLDNKRRCNPYVSYGKTGDYRVDTRTLEYRVPGGALLKTPELSESLLFLCKTVIDDAVRKATLYTNYISDNYNYKNKCISLEELIQNTYPYLPTTERLVSLINSPTVKGAIEEVPNIREYLNKMSGQHAKIYKTVEYFADNTSYSNDVYENWLSTS